MNSKQIRMESWTISLTRGACIGLVFAAVLSLVFAFSAPTRAAAQELAFDIATVETCLADAEPEGREACVGLAAAACMERSEGGYSTYGMSGCLGLEYEFWDAMLNEVYAQVLAADKLMDADMDVSAGPADPLTSTLKEMQRTWIAYRDGLCQYSYAHWAGGTGAGPASVDCMLRETARQTFILMSWRDQ